MKDKQRKMLVLAVSILIGITCLVGGILNYSRNKVDRSKIAQLAFKKTAADKATGFEITEDFLTVNPYSRPGTALTKVNNIVVHYVANPGSTAKENRDYFEGLATSRLTSASSHYVVGLKGEIIQCIPLNEVAYCSNDRNNDTISIEVCHPGEDGKFNEDTYNSLVSLCAWLCDAYELDSESLIRHYDITGKICPKYFVEHPDKWKKFKKDVKKEMK